MNDSELLYFIQKNFEETIGQPLYKYQQNLCKLQGNVIINKSRQTGITTALACIALWKALLQKKTVLICSPSERQSHHVLEIIKRFLNNKKNAVEIPIVAENQSTIQFNQGKILSLPNSPETIRGETADIVIMDEFAHFLNATDDKIMEALTPTLSRGGQLWLISTPYGERGKHWEIWTDSKKYPEYERVLIHYSECPDIKIDSIRRSMDEISFKQEYENEFIGEIETFFPYTLLHSCVDTSLNDNNTTDVLCYGVDFGRVHDATFIIGIKKTADNKAIVQYIKEMKSKRFAEQTGLIDSLVSVDSRIELCVDKTGLGLPLYESLWEKHGGRVRGISFTNELKEKMMVNLKLRFEQQSIRIPDNTQLITQIHSIKRTMTAGARAKYDTGIAEEHHGDAAWALALALWNMDEVRASFEIF